MAEGMLRGRSLCGAASSGDLAIHGAEPLWGIGTPGFHAPPRRSRLPEPGAQGREVAGPGSSAGEAQPELRPRAAIPLRPGAFRIEMLPGPFFSCFAATT